MFTEVILATSIYAGYKYIKSDKRKIRRAFKACMIGVGLKNKNGETFEIIKCTEKKYGFECTINIPFGLSVEHLNQKINIIQDNLNCLIKYEKDEFHAYIKAKFITRDISKFDFKPVKCKENKIFIGKDITGKTLNIDLNKDPHILISGTTGTGKTTLMTSIISNIIYNSKNQIYILQTTKSDLSVFRWCKCVKFCSSNLEETLIAIRKIDSICKHRNDLFSKFNIKNIDQWNKRYPNRHMKRIVVFTDEFSFWMENEELTDLSSKLVKIGRSLGVHLIAALQRTTITELPSITKSQMSKITFKQKSSVDSINVIGTDAAVKLKPGEFIIDSNKEIIRGKSPFVDDDLEIIKKYIDFNEANYSSEIVVNNYEKEVLVEPISYKELPKGEYVEQGSIEYEDDGTDWLDF